MSLRLNRAIAAAGLCSRRQADELIAAGRVCVNGRVVTDFNFSVDFSSDQLEVDGQQVLAKHHSYVMLYKPRGIVTTCSDDMGRRSVLDLLPENLRHLRPIGRLDRDSEGLLLLSNDGDLAQTLTHPSKHVFKRYEVRVQGRISDSSLGAMRIGMRLEDGLTLPTKTKLLDRNEDESIFEIALQEGRNRQIRRMCAQLGHPIIRLVRVAIGELQLRHMEPGDWRRLTPNEVDSLRTR